MRTHALFVCIVLLTVFGVYTLLMESCESQYCGNIVWWYSWLTAASTGLGVLPFMFVHDMGPWWLGFCNGTRRARCQLLLLSLSFIVVAPVSQRLRVA